MVDSMPTMPGRVPPPHRPPTPPGRSTGSIVALVITLAALALVVVVGVPWLVGRLVLGQGRVEVGHCYEAAPALVGRFEDAPCDDPDALEALGIGSTDAMAAHCGGRPAHVVVEGSGDSYCLGPPGLPLADSSSAPSEPDNQVTQPSSDPAISQPAPSSSEQASPAQALPGFATATADVVTDRGWDLAVAAGADPPGGVKTTEGSDPGRFGYEISLAYTLEWTNRSDRPLEVSTRSDNTNTAAYLLFDPGQHPQVCAGLRGGYEIDGLDRDLCGLKLSQGGGWFGSPTDPGAKGTMSAVSHSSARQLDEAFVDALLAAIESPTILAVAFDSIHLRLSSGGCLVDDTAGLLNDQISMIALEGEHLTGCIPDLDPTPSTATEATTTWCVHDVAADDVLNLRRGPGVDHPILVGIPPFSCQVTAPEPAETTQVGRSTWRRVSFLGLDGWVNTRFLTPAPGSGGEGDG